MSRVSKTLKNAKVSTFFFIITTVIGFYSRSIFLARLGDDFMGLTATLQSFLQFLNLVELGIGSAMGFALYKSLFNNDHDRLNELFALIGYLYNRVGKIVLILGLVLSFFFPLIFQDITISLYVIYYVFYVYLFSSLLSYLYNYHLILLQADQKGYIPTSYQQTAHITKVCFQIAALYFTNSFVVFITIEFISLITFNLLIHKRIKKEYPWLKFFNKGDKSLLKKNKEILTKIKQMFVHKIASFILKSTDNIVIFSFVSLQSVTYVNNYYLITGSATSLLTNFLSGTGAAVGSLVAENNKTKISKVFWELMGLNHYVGGLLVLAMYYGINPVIGLWLGERYIMDTHIVMLLLANVYIMKMRVPMDEFINAYGMFHDIWAPITEGILNLLVSIVLASYLGVSGVLLGTFISVSLIALGWKPYFLFKEGFKTSIWNYWKGFSTLLVSFIIAFSLCHFIITNYVIIESRSWFALIISLIQVGGVIFIVYTSLMYLLNKGFKTVFRRIVNLVKNKIGRF